MGDTEAAGPCSVISLGTHQRLSKSQVSVKVERWPSVSCTLLHQRGNYCLAAHILTSSGNREGELILNVCVHTHSYVKSPSGALSTTFVSSVVWLTSKASLACLHLPSTEIVNMHHHT